MVNQTSLKLAQTPNESQPESQSEPGSLSLDVIYGILSNQRRRYVLRYLVTVSETTTLGEITEHIASIENEKPTEAISSKERKTVYICLYQCHLPKMDDADVIDFDENRKTIEIGENIDQLMRFLPEQKGVVSEGEPSGWTTAFTDRVKAIDRRLKTLTLSLEKSDTNSA